MNYLEIFNTLVLVALATAYFIQNNQLKFMKTMIDSFQPDKLIKAQEYIDTGKDYELKIKLNDKSKEIEQIASKEFKNTHQLLIDRYEELMQLPLHFMKSMNWDEREKMLKNYPKNYEIMKSLLKNCDKDALSDEGK